MNQLLEQTSAAILQRVDPRLRPVVEKLVESGKRVMYSEKTRELAMQQLAGGTDPENIGAGVAQLAGMLFTESNRTVPMQALAPASAVLLAEALAFLEEAGAVQVDEQFLAACTQALGASFLQLLGITPEKLQEVIGQQPAAGAAQPAAQQGIVAGAMGGA